MDRLVEQSGSLHMKPERRSVAVVGPLEVSDEELQDQVGIGVVEPRHERRNNSTGVGRGICPSSLARA